MITLATIADSNVTSNITKYFDTKVFQFCVIIFRITYTIIFCIEIYLFIEVGVSFPVMVFKDWQLSSRE